MGGAQTLKNSAVFTEIESEFWAEIGNSNDFSAQNQVISKKKKKRSSPKFEQFFRPNSGDLQKKKKKKKRSSPKFERFFRPNSALLLNHCSITVTSLFNMISGVLIGGGPGPLGPPPPLATPMISHLSHRPFMQPVECTANFYVTL